MVKNTSLPTYKLENILSHKVTKKRLKKAVVRIQTAVRKFFARVKYRRVTERREKAARYLQRIWKRYRMVTMVPKAWRKFKYDRLTRIQKYLRGYLDYKRVFTEKNNKKLKSNFDYFDRIRKDLYENAQIKIRYHWLKHKKQLALKREAESKKKSKEKSSKKGHMYKRQNSPVKVQALLRKDTSKTEEKHKMFSSTLPKIPEFPLIKLQTTDSSVGSNLLGPIQSNNIEGTVEEERHEDVHEEREERREEEEGEDEIQE
jgi:hypothetical protein